ncbi:MAG: hypothetical protein ABII07_06005 [Patescibacteria group bacterium]|nr:hypothetical protein [Patescibacteria group bacterium]
MKTKIIVSIVLATLLVGAVTYFTLTQRQPMPEDKTDPIEQDCDINGDGIIEEKELQHCEETSTGKPDQNSNSVDIRLPSDSTGSKDGTLAMRIYLPDGESRYEEGAPVIIWSPGGYEMKGIDSDLSDYNKDFIVLTFIYPGATDPWSGFSSDGEYDDRGENCIAATRDAVLFAGGKLKDSEGRTIDEVAGIPVFNDNVGMIGVSNGGNMIVAAAALYGELMTDTLKYLIQWETPVSSQIANRDFGRIVYDFDTGRQGDYFNERFIEYGPQNIEADWSDLAYDPEEDYYIVFHDGDGDSKYTTMNTKAGRDPNLNSDSKLAANEDWPIDSYPEGDKKMYSRAVTYALEENNVFGDNWPKNIGTPEEADAYWDIRESVWMYDDVTEKMPDLKAMVLANVLDHVQSSPQKLHIHQAFEGWDSNGAWVKLNPSPTYIEKAGRSSEMAGLPNNIPNEAPEDWYDIESYCIPEAVEKYIYQLAAVWEMMDEVYKGI